jgi:hypothetical protein
LGYANWRQSASNLQKVVLYNKKGDVWRQSQ